MHSHRRRPPRVGARVLLIALVFAMAATAASAAGLASNSTMLGGGGASIPACDSDGFAFANTLDAGGSATAVTVGGIASGCAGGTLLLTLASAAGAALGSGSAVLPSSGFAGSATVTLSPQPPISQVAAYRAAITDP